MEHTRRTRLEGLEAGCFQHEVDRYALDKLNNLPYIPKLMGWLADRTSRNLECELAGGEAAVVSEASSPEVWRVYRETCETLGMTACPPLYVIKGIEVNAFTMGVDAPAICVTDYAVDTCTDEELRFIFGHELGHVLCGHVKFLTLENLLSNGVAASVVALGPIVPLVVMATLQPLLRKLSRVAEISADRAGLLACQDFESCCGAFLKIEGQPHMRGGASSPSQILSEQLDLFRQKYEKIGLAQQWWKDAQWAFSADHPRIVNRFACLREWVEMNFYDELVRAQSEDRHRIAENARTDSMRQDLLVRLALDTAEYLERRLGIRRCETLPDIRKTYQLHAPLRGPAAECLLMADLVVRKIAGDQLEYELQLYVRTPEGRAVRARIVVPYESDWSFAPEGFREKFIRDRVSEIKVCLYQVG